MDGVTSEGIQRRIFVLRGQKVMLSTDLAELYDVEARALVQASSGTGSGFRRFYVPIDQDRVLKLEITNCDFKLGSLVQISDRP